MTFVPARMSGTGDLGASFAEGVADFHSKPEKSPILFPLFTLLILAALDSTRSQLLFAQHVKQAVEVFDALVLNDDRPFAFAVGDADAHA